MHLDAPSRLLLACSLAFMPFSTVSWEITMSDLEEKNVNEFSSSGLKCPTCFAVKGRKCSPELKWCPTDKIKCVEFSGIINTGVSDIAIELKKCITIDLCRDTVTSYMGFPVTNKSQEQQVFSMAKPPLQYRTLPNTVAYERYPVNTGVGGVNWINQL